MEEEPQTSLNIKSKEVVLACFKGNTVDLLDLPIRLVQLKLKENDNIRKCYWKLNNIAHVSEDDQDDNARV